MKADAIITVGYLPKMLGCWQQSAFHYPQHASTCRDCRFLLSVVLCWFGFLF